MSKKVSILVGSLRKGSFARKIAQNVIPMFPEGYEAQIVEIGHFRKQPYRTGLPEKRHRYRLQTQCRCCLEKNTCRHHQPFSRQNGRL